MRIGIVHPALRHRGGAENLTVWIAGELATRGHTITLCAAGIDRSLWPDVDWKAVRAVDLPDIDEGYWHQWRRSRTNGRAVHEALRDSDVAVAGNFPSYWWLADAVADMPGRPATVLYCHEPVRKFYFSFTDQPSVEYVRSNRNTLPGDEILANRVRSRLRKHRWPKGMLVRRHDRRALAHIDRIVANSDFTRRNAAEAWSRDVTVCYPGAPTPRDGAREAVADRSGVVVFTGWEVAKNPMGVLGAIQQVMDRHGREDIRFIMTGSDEAPPQYSAYVREHHLERIVDFRGFVSEAEKGELLASSRLCLFVPLAEPFGLVPVEAMLRATPVVASDHGGPSEVVTDGKTGTLVDPFSPNEIADAIVRLYDDADRLRSMGSRATARASDTFTLQACVDRFERILTEALEAR